MKNISLLLLAGVVFFASCQKKNDELIQQEQTSGVNSVQLSAWKGVSFTANGTEGSDSAFFSTEISDPAIDSSILSEGLVLIYSRENSSINTLPFGQASNIEWSYEVKSGGILISANTSKTLSALSGLQFSYVVVPAAKIASLEESGTSVDDLVNASFSDAEKLFPANGATNN